MPDMAVHAVFGREVRAGLPEEIRTLLAEGPWHLALFGPDFWFLHPTADQRQNRGRRMHTTRTGAFLTALARKAREGKSRAEIFSYLAGFLCHYTLDSVAHPYIIGQTAEPGARPGSHRAFEHSLDILEMKRQGFWGRKHPLTGELLPSLRLPGSMAEDLDAVYGQVYGWKGCTGLLNRYAGQMRFLYRLMESRGGPGVFLARSTRSSLLRSLSYPESYYEGTDVENTEHRLWANPFDPALTSRESFADLKERARQDAVRMTVAAYRYLCADDADGEALREEIGDRSYFSFLPWRDARNFTVPGLEPSPDPFFSEI